MKCDYCGKDIYLEFRCSRCNGRFCTKHRLPELHECKNIHLRKEDIAVKYQLNKASIDDSGQKRAIASDFPPSRSLMSANELFTSDDELDRFQLPFKLNPLLTLIPFYAFLGIDIFLTFFFPISAILLVIHSIFLPYITITTINFKKGVLKPESLVRYARTIFTYFILYSVAKIVISIIILDFFSLLIFSLLLIRMGLLYRQYFLIKRRML
ncbi:MAG: AN1-type zinc finger domain-containing protein [Promethearchaeota archaeon]